MRGWSCSTPNICQKKKKKKATAKGFAFSGRWVTPHIQADIIPRGFTQPWWQPGSMARLRPATSAAQLPATQKQGVSHCWCPTSCGGPVGLRWHTWRPPGGGSLSLLYFSIFLLELGEFWVRAWQRHNLLLPHPSQLLCCHLFAILSSTVCDSCGDVLSGKSSLKAGGGCFLSSLLKCSYIMGE